MIFITVSFAMKSSVAQLFQHFPLLFKLMLMLLGHTSTN